MEDGAPGAAGRRDRAEPTAGPIGLGPPEHPCRLAPVVREVGAFLAGPDASDDERQRAACGALRNTRTDFETFAASGLAGTDLVSVELSISRPGPATDRDAVSVHTHLPSPLTLLLVCARNCDDGDLVGLRQRTAKCGEMFSEARWPFGLAEAEMLTRPAPLLFADLQSGAAEHVGRRERVVRGLGRVVTEREVGADRVWLPRVRRWHDEERGVRGLAWRWGVTRRRVGRRARSGAPR